MMSSDDYTKALLSPVLDKDEDSTGSLTCSTTLNDGTGSVTGVKENAVNEDHESNQKTAVEADNGLATTIKPLEQLEHHMDTFRIREAAIERKVATSTVASTVPALESVSPPLKTRGLPEHVRLVF